MKKHHYAVLQKCLRVHIRILDGNNHIITPQWKIAIEILEYNTQFQSFRDQMLLKKNNYKLCDMFGNLISPTYIQFSGKKIEIQKFE